MKRIKESQKNQGILFSHHYIGDRLAENDEVYLFDALIDKLDISSITNSYSHEGGSMYSPRDQLAVILYAYYKGVTSSVKIAELVRKSLPFIYLAGGHLISRRTICDFRIKHRERIKEIFVSSVNVAIQTGVVKNDKVYAVDGSKFEANASFSKTRKKKEWNKRQDEIIEHVEKFLNDWEEQDKLEEDIENERRDRFNEVREKLKKIKNGSCKKDVEPKTNREEENKKKESSAVYKKNKITVTKVEDVDKFLNEHENISSLLNKYKSADDNMLLNLTDPDCRIMKSDSITKECYNVQVVSNNQVIVAVDVTQDENDQHQLEPMIKQLKENIKLGDKNIIFTADAGYNMGKNLKYISQDNSIDAYISMFDRSEKNNPDKNKFHKENFEYDKINDSWKCSNEKELKRIHKTMSKNKEKKIYGCDLKECIFCNKRNFCIKTKADIKRGYRTIEDDGYLIDRKEMRTKMQQEKSKKIYSKRSGSVEPVFGQIKNNRNFTRFRLKSRKKVQTEFTIMAIAHNIGKIINYSKEEGTIFKECTA